MSTPEGGGNPSTRGDGGRGRGRGRGPRNNQPRGGDASSSGDKNARGSHRGNSQRRGGRGGRGGGHRRGASRDETLQTVPAEPAAQEVAAAVRRPSAAAAAGDEADDDDAEVCFICANPVAYYSIAPCNHATCHICALRMRVLYKTNDCATCRTPAPFVIFTEDAEKRFEEYTDADISTTDPKVGIKYAKEDIVGDTVLLLRYNCPDPSCDFAGYFWPDLHHHVKSAHSKRMCDLCTRNKKVFAHEHELFTDKELDRHMRHGDDRPGAADQTGFKGHPLCDFCGERFYDNDRLYEHCRMKHERCFLCDRADSRKPHYFKNYDALENHFRKDHFLCADRECLEKKFVVFGSRMDLQAHQISEHPGKNIGRDARVVDISSFDLREPYNSNAGGRDEGRRGGRNRGGRGRDPNSDNGIPIISDPSTQPMRRDQLAYQRTVAIHSAQSVSNRTFGGQLTASAAAPPSSAAAAASSSSSARPSRTGTPANPSSSSSAPAPAQSTTARPRNAAADNMLATSAESLTISDPSNLTPEERARRVRHGSVIERASNLLGNDAHRLSRFRDHISAYNRGPLTAPELIDIFFNLFADTSSNNALGTLIKELADLFDDKKKADGLRRAWQDRRAVNEEYPGLPTLDSMHGTTSSSRGSGWASAVGVNNSSNSSSQSAAAAQSSQRHSTRVLKLKNNTRLAGPGPAPTPATRGPPGWVAASSSSSGGVKPPSSSSAAFPSLPPAASSSRQGGSGSRPTWIGSLTQPPSSSSAPQPGRVTGSGRGSGGGGSSGSGSRSGGGSGDNFPALPSAPKPTTTIFGYGTGRAVRRDYGHAESNFQWGGSGGGGASSSAAGTPAGEDANDADGDDAGGKGKKGGKKNKKQVLVQWG